MNDVERADAARCLRTLRAARWLTLAQAEAWCDFLGLPRDALKEE